MRILFCSDTRGPDYLCDALLHGLALMPEVKLDVCGLSPLRHVKWRVERRGNPFWFMLNSSDPLHLSKIQGQGFTLYGKLDKCGTLVSPFTVIRNLANDVYDLVLVCAWRTSWILNILDLYKCRNVVALDGEDDQTVHALAMKCHRYYKRELNSNPTGNLRPISFAIPEPLIVHSMPNKSGLLAHLIPGAKSTYIYETEQLYYQEYQSHIFGLTMKKGGWDCLRHYEIAMNGCLPLMRDIDKCPPFTMTTSPKNIFRQAVAAFESCDTSGINSLTLELLQHVRAYNTTKALANYVLEESL